jgi:hypothetical protein
MQHDLWRWCRSTIHVGRLLELKCLELSRQGLLIPAAAVETVSRMAHWRSRGLSAPETSPLSRRLSHEGVGCLNWSRSRRAGRVHAPGSRPDVEGPRLGVLVGGPGERQARAVPLPVGVAATAAEVGAGPATSAATTRGAAEGVGAAPVPPATALAAPGKTTRVDQRCPAVAVGAASEARWEVEHSRRASCC